MIKLGDSAMDELIVVRGSYRITYNDRIDRWYIWNAKGPYLEVKGCHRRGNPCLRAGARRPCRCV